ncbi:MAG: Nudix family hydrolase [Luteimonas sp.]
MISDSPPPVPDSPLVEVVAAVITDATGRVLLARRTDGRDLAGLWEFPGGKREPGETPDAALARELHEELGITARIGAPVMAVAQQMPSKRLRLDVRRVSRWTGTPRGREGQALAWVPPHKLSSYAMPPADRPVVAALLQPDRLLVTPEPHDADDGSVWLASLERALAAGIRRVQIRLPTRDAAHRERIATAAVARCRVSGADVWINGDAALAQRLDIGLHLRAAQLMQLPSRPIAEHRMLGASCHDATELQAAVALGCDFVIVGPVLPTATHPGTPGIGWNAFEHLREQVDLPIYAIGGLGPDDIPTARQHGAQGIAAIRSLWPDPTATHA